MQSPRARGKPECVDRHHDRTTDALRHCHPAKTMTCNVSPNRERQDAPVRHTARRVSAGHQRCVRYRGNLELSGGVCLSRLVTDRGIKFMTVLRDLPGTIMPIYDSTGIQPIISLGVEEIT